MTTTAPEQRRLLSGIAGLDTILGGGFMLGGLYIVQGAPGAGKTILANQICFHHVAGGGKAMFVTLLAENHARMIGNLRQMSFFDETRIGDALTYLSGFNEMQEGGLAELTKLLRREIQRRRISVLVIDGLVTAAASAPNEQAFKVFVHDLQEVALATDCTMFLTTNAGREVSPEQTMVDGLIMLSDRVYGWRAESDLQVTKFRGAGYLRGRHAYKIGNAGFVVYPRIEALFAYPSRAAAAAGGRVASGIARLDAMLGGGIPPASTTMVMGPSGIGKTTIGLHFLSRSSSRRAGTHVRLLRDAGEPARQGRPARPGARPAVRQRGGRAALADADERPARCLRQDPHRGRPSAQGQAAVHRRPDGFRSGAVDPSSVGNFFSALSNELRVHGVTTVYSLEVPNIVGPAVARPGRRCFEPGGEHDPAALRRARRASAPRDLDPQDEG